MNFESLLVVTYGRSGSTLLMGVLNSIPGVLIRGENYNFCANLHQAYQTLERVVDNHSGPKTQSETHPWFGGNQLSLDSFVDDATTMIRNQLVPNSLADNTRCYGFKEIRYLPGASQSQEQANIKLASYLDFLELVFPNPAIVSLTRDHDAIAASGWWQDQDSEIVRSRLTNFEQALTQSVAHRDNHYGLTYDDLVQQSDNLVALFTFLGVPFDQTAVQAVLETRHSYS